MATRAVEFPGAGGRMVEGRLELPPDGEPRACALFAHCYSCTKDHKAAVYVSRALAARQIAVLRFDFAGTAGDAEDDATGYVARSVEDMIAAAGVLERDLAPPALLIGHSLGGSAALLAAPEIPSVAGVVTIGTPARASRIRGVLPAAGGEGGGDFLSSVRELGAALLIMHATDDDLVSLDDAARLYTAARHPKSFVALPDAGHLLLRQEDAQYAAGVLAAWAERYLPPVEHSPPGEQERPTRVTVATGREGFRTTIGVRAHTLLADEPVAVGGTDTGPTPYDLLVAALGACTTMTVQLYARRKGWPLDEAVARLRHAKVYAADQERCEDEPVRLDRVERELELRGDLDATQRQRLLEIADRCPVHRTMEGGVDIRTTLSQPSARPADD